MAGSTTKFKLYREGSEVDEIEVNSTMTVAGLQKIKDAYHRAGFTVVINGTTATESQVQQIANDLSRAGIAIRVNSQRATGSTPIPNGSVVAAAGEQKGGRA